jgi:hypothetical protein
MSSIETVAAGDTEASLDVSAHRVRRRRAGWLQDRGRRNGVGVDISGGRRRGGAHRARISPAAV